MKTTMWYTIYFIKKTKIILIVNGIILYATL
jgi:hypothetical protein